MTSRRRCVGPRTASGLGFALDLGRHVRPVRRSRARACSTPAGAPARWCSCGSALAALVVAPFAVVALRGRWDLLRRSAGIVIGYGVLAVAGAQFCYFSAVQHMQVGPALLIEYTAPAAVVVWLWLRQGQRPGAVTLLGAGLAAVGLVLVLDVVSGASVNVPGVLWALAAMVGAAAYFLISADESTGHPADHARRRRAGCGRRRARPARLCPECCRWRPRPTSTSYAGTEVAWWVPLVALGLVTAAVAYVTGIAAIRRLGSRVASFVALTEVVAGVVWAWLLLDELPRPIQLVGGLLILVGVIGVKLGEKTVVRPEPTPA